MWQQERAAASGSIVVARIESSKHSGEQSSRKAFVESSGGRGRAKELVAKGIVGSKEREQSRMGSREVVARRIESSEQSRERRPDGDGRIVGMGARAQEKR
jgi:hypothetical protein